MAKDSRTTGANWWKFIAIGLGVIVVVAILVIWGYRQAWTGFGGGEEVVTSTRVEVSGSEETVTEIVETRAVPEKNLWDWLGLLIVPAILAGGAALIAYTQQNRELEERENDRQIAKKAREVELKIAGEARETDWEIARDRQEQSTLENYYDRMAELLLNHNLRSKAADDDEERSIARARTLTVLRSLNATRKGQVLRFLYESKLIKTPSPIVVLRTADLSGVNLRGAELSSADLSGANLQESKMNYAKLLGADLRSANLQDAEMSFAKLLGADLSGANLQDAEMSYAKLLGADLSEANLSGANLSDASLLGADLSFANLSGADLTGANHNTQTTWPDDFDPKAAGAILVDYEGNPIEEPDGE